MVNGISSLGTFGGATFRPEALQAYQQYLQQIQQANPQQTDRLTKQSYASLINPSGVAQAQNFATMVNNNLYQQLPYNDKYGNDIFAQQLFNNQTGQTYGNSGNYAKLNNSFVAGKYSGGDIFAQQLFNNPTGQTYGNSGNYAQLNNSFVAGKYSGGDIFAQQLYKTKPWEQISNQTTAKANAGYNFPQYQQNGYLA